MNYLIKNILKSQIKFVQDVVNVFMYMKNFTLVKQKETLTYYVTKNVYKIYNYIGYD